ncbi:hypothetical protein VTP01DRAFT_9319 [Rhizomucor pusillus]|uniref:uncharacterized protein n=1 Tax=Rhizomucor pusillus TaxID=4840 RepID=UPI003743CD7C
MHKSQSQKDNLASTGGSSGAAATDSAENAQVAAEKQQRDSQTSLFKKLLSERNRKLDELQQTHSVLQENLRNVNNETADSNKKDSTINTTKATMAFSLLGDLIDECIYDVISEVHKDVKQAKNICQICQTRCRDYSHRPGQDIFGNSYSSNNLPLYECVSCHKMIAASRYAPHLEKCMGLAGRQSSRVANRRLGSSSPFTSAAASSDHESVTLSDPESNTPSSLSDAKKKKRSALPGAAGGGGAPANGVSRVKKLKSSSSSTKF